MYRKRPVVVEAWQFTSSVIADWPEWLQRHEANGNVLHGFGGINIVTLEGTMLAQPGDWIIQGVKGEIYPCKPDVFAATYEAAEIERLPDDGPSVAGYPCGYCEAMVAIPCLDIGDADNCAAFRTAPKRPPDVEAMPPGARADAMRHDPEWRAQPIGPGEPIHEDDYRHPNQRATRFRDEIETVINSHSRENGSGTPDFVLAQFVLDVMDAFDSAVTRRQGWYGRPTEEKALIKVLNAQLQTEKAMVKVLKNQLQAEGERSANLETSVSYLQAQINAEGEHTAAGQAEIERLEAENAQLRGELQRVSMAGLAPSMVVGK